MSRAEVAHASTQETMNLLLTLPLLFTLAAPQVAAQSSAGETLAKTLLDSARLDAHADFLEEVALALNEPLEDLPGAVRDAWFERDEAIELAEEQYEARLAVFRAIGSSRYLPELDSNTFSENITNSLLPYTVGRTMVYEKQTAEGLERVEITVLADTVEIEGLTCRQVQDIAYLDGEVIEDTIDWYAQDANGDVWYIGEISKNYDEDGFLEDIDGSWRYGVDGAQPGIVMFGTPVVGTAYRQEYWINEAEDVARIMADQETVTVPAGTFTNCLMTLDGTAMEPDAKEYKYYAPGIGLVLEVDPESGERLELVQIL